MRGVFERTTGRRRQALLGHLTAARWQFYAAPGGWQDHWPASPGQTRAWPLAVAVDLVLGPGPGLRGTVRRVIALPVRSPPPVTAGI